MNACRRESGFSLVEVSVAASLVVAFALAFATSFGVAFGATRGNLLRQTATGVVNEEFEYVRALTWTELAMSSVDTSAPLLDDTKQLLVGAEVGFAGTETLAVFADTGLITPWRKYVVDGQDYQVWRYVTHAGGGIRRFVALVTWSEDGASESLLSSTLLSEVTARANPGGVATTAPGTPPTSSTTTSSTTSTTTSTTSTTTTSTTTTSTTTTTVPGGVRMVIAGMNLSFNRGAGKQTTTVDVVGIDLQVVSGATVYGIWSVTPTEIDYPVSVQQITSASGRATFVHNDGHPAGSVVQFCVTGIIKTGYFYDGGIQCVSGTW
jgi:hypothetical protein